MVGVALVVAGCATLPQDVSRPASYGVERTDETRLGQRARALTAAHPGLSGVHPLRRGTDAFLARLALTAVAERSLDLQYYIWHNDLTGRFLVAKVLEAAERGVRVRILIDDLGTSAKDEGLLMLDAHPSIEVRLFNPVALRRARGLGALLEFRRINRRMHNKSFTADNQFAIVGGRNIGDEYFEAGSDLDFGDLDVIAVGPVVREVSSAFDLYWNSESAFPITAFDGHTARSDEALEQTRIAARPYVEEQRGSPYAEALRRSELAARVQDGGLSMFWGETHLVYDDPAKVVTDRSDRSTHLGPQLAPLFEGLQHELRLVSPYFVPGEEGVDLLRRLRERGVRVMVLTNSLAATDVAAVHSGYARYRRDLLRLGVELYEIKATAARPDGAPPADAASAAYATSRASDAERSATGGEHRSAFGVGGSSRASLHAKTFIFDRRVVFVGSLNLDPRSTDLNTEIGVLIDSRELAADLIAGSDAHIDEVTYRLELAPPGASASTSIEWVAYEDGREVRFDAEPDAGLLKRLGVWFLSLLPIESQL